MHNRHIDPDILAARVSTRERHLFYFRSPFSTFATARMVLMMESGLSDMLSIPCSTRNFAKDGWSEGPWPQMPTYFFFLRHTLMTSAMSFFTAALFSSATRFTIPESRSSPRVSWVRSLEPMDMPSNSFRNSSASMALEGISHMTMTGVAVFLPDAPTRSEVGTPTAPARRGCVRGLG